MTTTKQFVISLTFQKTFLIVCPDDILTFILLLMIYFYIQSDSLLPLARAVKRALFGSIERANVDMNILNGKTIIMCLGVVGSYSFVCKYLCPSDLGFSRSVLSLIYSALFSFSIHFLKLMLVSQVFYLQYWFCFIFYSFLFLKFTSWAIYSNSYSTLSIDFWIDKLVTF